MAELLAQMEGVTALIASVVWHRHATHGGHAPAGEDVDFDRQAIIVREAKGNSQTGW